MKKIQKKWIMPLTGLIMVAIMTCVVSFCSTVINMGFSEDFVSGWMKGWGFSFVIASPIFVVLMPRVKKIIEKLTE